MENASKALLIAGSMLIAVLLIAFGMRIFNSTKGTTEQVKGAMTTMEVSMFNNKFTQYIGTNKTKAQATALINQMIISNSMPSNKDRIVKLTFKTEDVSYATSAGNNMLKKILAGESWQDNFAKKDKFNIEVIEYFDDGCVKLIRMLFVS